MSTEPLKTELPTQEVITIGNVKQRYSLDLLVSDNEDHKGQRMLVGQFYHQATYRQKRDEQEQVAAVWLHRHEVENLHRFLTQYLTGIALDDTNDLYRVLAALTSEGVETLARVLNRAAELKTQGVTAQTLRGE